MKLIAINYHYIRPSYDSPHPGIYGIVPRQFEQQLDQLLGVGEFVSAENIRAAVREESSLPERAFVLTFDDGLREQYEWAWPILSRRRIPAIFFINTGPIERCTVSTVHKIHLLRSRMPTEEFLSRMRDHARKYHIPIDELVEKASTVNHYFYDTSAVAQLKYLLNFGLPFEQRDLLIAELFEEAYPNLEADISRQLYMTREQITEIGRQGCIGSHGHEHVPLGLLSEEDMKSMVRLSVECLSDWIGEAPYAMSYPYGNPDASSELAGRLASQEGIEYCFTMERAANADFRDPMHLARFDHNDIPGGKKPRYDAEQLFNSVPNAAWFRKNHGEDIPKCAS